MRQCQSRAVRQRTRLPALVARAFAREGARGLVPGRRLDPLEAGEAATLLASDRASTMTVAAANITCGQLAD